MALRMKARFGQWFLTTALLGAQVLLGKSTCTEKVDIYSYGVVLWEICAGEAPTGRQLRPLRSVSRQGFHQDQPWLLHSANQIHPF